MSTTSDIRNGLCIKYNHDIYKIIEFLHVKPGKGPAFVRTKLKSLTSGKVVDNTFSAGHKIDVVRVETNKFQYLYNDSTTYHFMNTDDYNQISIEEDRFGIEPEITAKIAKIRPRVKIYEIGGDIMQTDILNSALVGAEGVFHFAALWLLQCHDYPRAAFDINIRGTFNVMEACRINKVKKLIYSSKYSSIFLSLTYML